MPDSLCRLWTIGRRNKNFRAKKRCWAFTSLAIRWMNSRTRSANWPRTTPNGWRAWSAGPRSRSGILTGVQRKRNKKGEPYAQMVLEDRLGTVEAMVFAKQYNDVLPSLAEDKAVLVRGVVVPQVDAPTKLSVLSVIPLESARVHLPSLISIRVSVGTNGTRDKAEALNQLFDKKRGDTEVRLRIEKARDFSVILDVATKVKPDKEFQAEIERICGPEAVEVLAS